MTLAAVPSTGLSRTGVRVGFYLAATVTACAVVADGLLCPLHAAGWFQPLLDYLNGLTGIFLFPGVMASRIGRARLSYPEFPTAWLIALALNVAFWFTAGFVLGMVWRWANRPRRAVSATSPDDEPGTVPEPTGSLSRRRFLTTGLKVCGAGATAALGYGLVLEPRRLEVTHRVFLLRGLPPALEGLRAVQITDVHHGPWFSLARVRALVEAVNDLRPDLVLLTGDYIHESPAYILPVVEELARLRPLIGTLAVLGNHDWLQDGPRTREELELAGIPVIDNDRRVLTLDRVLVSHAAEGLAFCGVGDLKEDRQDYRRALSGLPQGMPRLLLSHNPDVAEERGLVEGGLRVDLIVSGHTHGGQIRLPFVGTPIVHSRYGAKYRQGLVQGPVCPVFICRGLGVVGLPIRLGVTPELAVLEFRAAPLDT